MNKTAIAILTAALLCVALLLALALLFHFKDFLEAGKVDEGSAATQDSGQSGAHLFGRPASGTADETGYVAIDTPGHADPNTPESALPAAQDSALPAEPEAPNPRQGAYDALRTEIDECLRPLDGVWAVYVEDLRSGAVITGDKDSSFDEPLASASIIKIFVLATAYQQIEDGVLQEDQIYADLYNMITLSDNYATNRLVKLLGGGDAAGGMAKINAYAASVGCTATQMNRLMLDMNGLENYTSVTDCATLLKLIDARECISAYASEKMLEMLLDHQFYDYVPDCIPEDTRIACKGGDISHVCHGHVGIVYLTDGAYVFGIICNDTDRDRQAEDAILEIAALIYTRLTEPVS